MIQKYKIVLSLVLCLAANANLSAELISFDNLNSLPGIGTLKSLKLANDDSSFLAGGVWDERFFVVGSGYVEANQNQGGSNPFAIPHSGDYALFNQNADDGLTLNTTRVMTGAWFARPDMGIGPAGTNQVTVNAIGSGVILASETITLSSTTPAFLDMSSFLTVSGIDQYRFDRVETFVDGYGGGHYILDDVSFSAVPEPSSFALLGLAITTGLLRRKNR